MFPTYNFVWLAPLVLYPVEVDVSYGPMMSVNNSEEDRIRSIQINPLFYLGIVA